MEHTNFLVIAYSYLVPFYTTMIKLANHKLNISEIIVGGHHLQIQHVSCAECPLSIIASCDLNKVDLSLVGQHHIAVCPGYLGVHCYPIAGIG